MKGMKDNNFRAFQGENGVNYYFDYKKFKEQFDYMTRKRGTKKTLYEQLNNLLNCEVSTIEGWRKGNSGPSDLKIVRKLENFFNMPPDSFLTLKTKSMQKNELEENTMREIKDYERDVARKLYAQMCDMVDGLEYYPEKFIQGTAGRIYSTPQGFKYLGEEAFPFMYRDNLIQNVRKAGFDLPKQTRDQLIDFIFKAFGDGCSDTGMMYFESQEYKDYLEKNGFENSDDTRDLYSVLYIKKLYERLDAIFADYLYA